MPTFPELVRSQAAFGRASRYLKKLTIKRQLLAGLIITLVAAVSIWKLTPSSSALTNGGVMLSIGSPVTEDFDTLAQTGTFLTWSDNTTIPGWYSSSSVYNTGTGSSNTGSLMSFGRLPVSDRAIGSLASVGTNTVTYGTRLINNTGVAITSLDISYTGEQWRKGGGTDAQTLVFQYQVVDANALSNINGGTWTTFNALSFTSPINTAGSASLDGNSPANRTPKAASLTVNVNQNQEIWLRWVDIDDVGNDHGFGVDDLSVTPLHSDPISITSATANPSIVDPGAATLLMVAVSPGANPASTGLSVTGDLSPIGGPASQTFFDDGTNGDVTPNDNVFSFQTSVSPVTPGGLKNLTVQASDTQLRNSSGSIGLTVNTATPLSATGSATPVMIHTGDNTLLTVMVVPGAGPTSTGIGVTANLAAIGGSPTQQLYDDGTNGDLTAGNNLYSYLATVANGTSSGSKSLPVNVNDAQGRSATPSIAVSVVPNIIINELDSDTVGTDNGEFVELFDGGAGNTALDGLVVVFYNGNNDLSYAAFDLAGHSTDANGYFTLGNAAVPGVDLVFNDGLLQNGADAVAIYFANSSAFPNNTPVTTSNLLDAVVYDTSDPDDPGLLTLVNFGEPQVNENGSSSGTTQSIHRCPNGSGGGRNTSTFGNGTPSPDTNNNCLITPPPSGNNAIVISQIYGGGGNAGATFQNDYVELYNRGANTVDISGWSLQYASSTGNSWDSNKQPLGGIIGPGEYLLIGLAGGPNGSMLPVTPNISGEINLSATTGKLALVSNFEGLSGNCPTADSDVVDFVGYGSADCHEGFSNATAPGNTTAIFRQGGGTVDTNNNGNDFAEDTPSPRRTAPIVELGPMVLNTDPRSNGFNAPRDASINITFTEPVTVSGAWFNISCANTGSHNSATVVGADKDWVITPNSNFLAGEQCTVTIDKDSIHDVDSDDSNANTDTLPANYSWSFTISTGTAPPYLADVHLSMGNPNGATADSSFPNNYLMEKPEFALSYNRDHGGPNWVSWHLSDEWVGTLTRVDTFRPDPAVLPDWYRVQANDFSGSGFDRGHMTPNADRDKETSIPINQATFLMSNMVPQSPDNNQGPWGALENYLRTLLPANELYIVAGPTGTGGTGSNGFATTIANGHVRVPSATWKVVLVISKGDNDLSRVSAGTQAIAVLMPNVQGIRNDPWENYLTTVDNIEALTGYDFFSNLPDDVENAIEAGTNGNNPPGTTGQSVTTAEDNSVSITLNAASPGGSLTYSIVDAPTHGQLVGLGANPTYQPNADYSGSDSFSFRVNDGAHDSNTSTVSIIVTEVNDSPTAADDSNSTGEDTALNFAAADLTTNDSTGAANESSQTLTVTSVTATANTHGSVTLNSGSVNYQPEDNYHGPAGFTYQVCDDGTTNGALDSKCATATVNLTVNSVNDNPVAVDDAASTNEDNAVDVDVVANDTDGDGDSRTLQSVGTAANGSVSIVAGQARYTPNDNFHGSDSLTYVVADGHGGEATGTVNVTVNSINDKPDAGDDSTSTDEDTPVTVDVVANDTDADGDARTLQSVGTAAHGSVSIVAGQAQYIPNNNFHGTDSFTYVVADGHGGTDTGTVNVNVNSINDNPNAADDSASTNEDNSLTVDVVANDTDIDGDARTLQSVGAAAHGSVSIVAGQAQYVPTSNYHGTDSFTYVVADGHGGSDTGTVNITVNPVNDSPLANGQTASTSGNTPVSMSLSGNDVETSSANLIYQVTVNPAHGSLTGSGANRTYTPALNYSGPDSFKFTVTDTGDGAAPALTSSAATVSITVNDTINPLVSAPANVTLGTGPGATSCSLFISDGTLGTASASDNSGVVSLERTGVPAGNVFPVGTTIITYTATDAAGNIAHVTQTVVVNDTTPPSLTAPAPTTATANSSGQAAVPNVVAGATASDLCGAVSVTQSPAAGTLVGVGTHTITLTATDAAGNTRTATTTFTVNSGGSITFTLTASPTSVQKGREATLTATYLNQTSSNKTVTSQLSYSGECGSASIGNIGPVTVPAGGQNTASYLFDVPKCTGIYTIKLESFVNGASIGSTTTTLTVTKDNSKK